MNYPDELSDGQKQRIAIARTLAMDPEIILFDEPTSALDPTMVDEVQSVIRELTKTGKTMMIVTHEMKFARAICNRVFYMDGGGIYEDGTPEQVFDHPKRENTRRFVFEELVQQMLLPKLESPHIQAVIEYSEADGQATMTVRYNGAPYDVLERGDELSRAMLMGNTKDISYDAADVDGFTNCMTLVFTEKQ